MILKILIKLLLLVSFIIAENNYHRCGLTDGPKRIRRDRPTLDKSFTTTNGRFTIHYDEDSNHAPVEGDDNIDVDPLFNEDFTLMANSPCIDAGIADLDGDGYEDMEYCGDAPDMGAFEYITEDCEESTLSGDLNSDGLINVLDVVVLVNIVLGYGEPIDAGDMNGDGVLNVLDVVALVSIILEG